MPVTYDLYGDRSGNTRNVLVEPNRVSWLKRHFARIRYGPRSGTGRIPFCRRAAWYGRCVHPTSTLWRSNCLLGSGSGAPNGLVCYSANRRSAGQFGTPELLITDLIGNKEHSPFKGYIYDAPTSKMRRSARRVKSDPECEIDPNEFGLYAVVFWASGTQ